MTPPQTPQMYSSEKRFRLALPRLQATYAWMPPFEGASRTRANRLEVVFSRHRRVALEQSGRTYDVDVTSGGFYVIGEEPTTLLSVPEPSDTLEMYPNQSLLEAVADESGRKSAMEPTLGRNSDHQQFVVEPLMLGIAHVLRLACLGLRTLSSIEASSLEHVLVRQLLGSAAAPRLKGQLGAPALARVVEKIECEVGQALTLDDLAAAAGMSPFHFARAFRRTTGLPPIVTFWRDEWTSPRTACLTPASRLRRSPHRSDSKICTTFGGNSGPSSVLPGDMRGAGSMPSPTKRDLPSLTSR